MVRQRWLKRGQGRRSKSNTHNTNKKTQTNNNQKSLTEHGEKVETSSGSHGYLHIPGSHYVFQQKIQGPKQSWRLCNASSVIDLLSLLPPAY